MKASLAWLAGAAVTVAAGALAIEEREDGSVVMTAEEAKLVLDQVNGLMHDNKLLLELLEKQKEQMESSKRSGICV